MKTIKIAITGGIGSGKSSVAKIIREQGFPVFSCDEINKQLLTQEEYIRHIKKRFPDVVQEGKIITSRLAQIVFSNETALKELNSIAHPFIMNELKRQIDTQNGLVFAEVPLLFECGYENLFHKIIVVYREKEQRILSVMQRDHADRGAVLSRISQQYDYSQVGSFSSVILLNNNSTVSKLKNKVLALLKRLSNEFS